MFKYNKPTDFEKLVIANSFIKFLKKELRKQEESTLNAKKNLDDFMAYMREFTKGTRKLVSYKREMDNHIIKSRKLKIENERLERKNFQLREKVRDLTKKNMLCRNT